jgi:hypothetical protein
MTDDRAGMDLLGSYWDELAKGEADALVSFAGHDDLDPTLVEALQRFHELGTTPPPGAARDRVWRELRAQMDNGQRDRETLLQATAKRTHPHIAPISNGRSDPRHGRTASLPIPIASRRRIGSFFSLAAAAVLVLALVGGLVAIRSSTPGSDDPRFGSLPVAQTSPDATPPAGVSLRTLVIPAASLPAGEIRLSSWVYTQPPGTTQNFPPPLGSSASRSS